MSAPPPPPFAPSTPSYYPLLYPTQPRRGIASSALGLGIGIICGMLIIGLLGVWAVHSGLFTHVSIQPGGPNVTTIITTGGEPHATPTALGGIGAHATTTPLPVITTTPGVLATVTPSPKPTVGPTSTPAPGPTPLPGVTPSPNPTPNPTDTAVPPTATPLPPLTVSVNLSVHKGNMMLSVNTAAGASLSISVLDCDGRPDPGAPISGTADDFGNFFASWHARMPPCGSATATVTATLDSQQGTGSGSVDF